MKRRYIVAGLFLTLILLTSSRVMSQSKLVSLSDYVSAALRNNPLVGAAGQEKESAVYSNEAIRKGYYPQVGVGSHIIVAPGYDPAITNGGEFAAQLSGSYLIYDGGSKALQMRKGGVGVEQGSVGESRTKADVVYRVSIAYIKAVKQKRELSIVEKEYALLADYLQLIRQLHAAGQGTETDLLKTTVDLNNTKIDINSRKVSYRNSLIALAEAAGLPSSAATSIDSVMPELSYDTTFNAVSNVELESQALALKQATLDARIARAKLRPRIAIVANAGALTSLPTLDQGLASVFGASVGVSISVPVFTFGSLQDSYRAARARARSVEFQNRYSKLVLEREFESTQNEIAKADSEIASLKHNLVIAKQNMVLSRAQYAGGRGLSLDVLNSIQMVNQIRMSIEEERTGRSESILKLKRINYSGAL